MAKNKKPSKKYVPKGVRPPVTKGLYDDLGADLHIPLMSLRHGRPSAGAWKKVAKILMTVSFATDNCPSVDKADKTAIDSAVLTLKSISDTEVRTGVWNVTNLDYLTLARGAHAVDKVLPRLDYRKLAHGYNTFVALTRSITE